MTELSFLKKEIAKQKKKIAGIFIVLVKVALGVCFTLKFVERIFTSFRICNYLM